MPLGDDHEGFRIRIIYDGFQYITGPLQDVIGYQAPGKQCNKGIQRHLPANCAVAISIGGTMAAGETTWVVQFLGEKGLV